MVLPSLYNYSSSYFATVDTYYCMYLCNTMTFTDKNHLCFYKHWRNAKVVKAPDWEPQKLASLRYLQSQQKADPSLERRGRCSSSCTAHPENTKVAQQQVLGDPLWKPLSEFKHTAVTQSGNAPHLFLWAGWGQQLFIYCNPYSKTL